MASFPRIDISEPEKNKNGKQWFKDVIEYAIAQHRNRPYRMKKIMRLYNSYNGFFSQEDVQHLNATYGKENMVKFINYRLGRTKIDILSGEQLELPLQATIMATNPEARSRKMEAAYPRIGMYYAKEQVEKLRKNANVNIFNGMPIPEVNDGSDPVTALTPKLQNEHYMQLLVNDTLETKDFKVKINECFKNIGIVSEAHFFLDIQDGRLVPEKINPEDALFEESDNDPFVKKSPYRGRRKRMYVHEILTQFDLTEEERDTIQGYQDSFAAGNLETTTNGYFQNINGQLAIEVYFVQWIGVKEIVDKKSKGKNGREYNNDVTDYMNKSLRNYKKIENGEKNGKYELTRRYKKTIYEGAKIGKSIYKNMREKEDNVFRMSDPTWCDYDYISLLFNTINGTRISIKQMTEHIERMYDLVMFQIAREMSKAKGKVLIYDEAAIPRGKGKSDVLYNMTNDGIVFVNSKADGNVSGSDLATLAGIKEVDLGLSNSIQQLISLKIDLQETADRITGILDNRMGIIPATATATNAQSAIQASRITTGAVFYYFDQFVEKIIEAICERYKIIADINPDYIESVIGKPGLSFIIQSSGLSMDDFTARIVNPRKEQAIRDKMDQYLPLGLQAGTVLPEDVLAFQLAETMAGARAVLEKSAQKIQQMKLEEQKAAADAAAQQTQMKIAADDERTAKMFQQAANLEGVKGQIGMGRDTQKARDKAVLQEQNNQSKERIAAQKNQQKK